MSHPPYKLIPALTDEEKKFVLALVGPKLANGCQPWLGSPNFGELQPKVYGQISLRGYPWVATRIVYTVMVGAFSEYCVIDHTCSNASCVNPEHLEPCSQGENSEREGPRGRTRMIARAQAIRAAIEAQQTAA